MAKGDFSLEKTWRMAANTGSTVFNASGNFIPPYGKQILSVRGKSNDGAANTVATYNANNPAAYNANNPATYNANKIGRAHV